MLKKSLFTNYVKKLQLASLKTVKSWLFKKLWLKIC